MATETTLTPELAADFYRRVDDPRAAAFLDFLIDHPDQQFDSEALQRELGFAEHKHVALAAYAIGEVARPLGLDRPWIEAQRGYTMPATTAEVLSAARGPLDGRTGG